MPTVHEYRILIVCPIGPKLAGVVNWIQNNVDPSCPADLGPGLSPSGNAPPTHHWQSAAWVEETCRRILFQMCNLGGVIPPALADWQSWPREQKLQWLAAVRDLIYAAFGIYLTLTDNTADWGTPDTILATMGLKRIGTAS